MSPLVCASLAKQLSEMKNSLTKTDVLGKVIQMNLDRLILTQKRCLYSQLLGPIQDPQLAGLFRLRIYHSGILQGSE